MYPIYLLDFRLYLKKILNFNFDKLYYKQNLKKIINFIYKLSKNRLVGNIKFLTFFSKFNQKKIILLFLLLYLLLDNIIFINYYIFHNQFKLYFNFINQNNFTLLTFVINFSSSITPNSGCHCYLIFDFQV